MTSKFKRALLASIAVATFLPAANATFLTGTTPILPGQSGVFPGLILPGTNPGTLLASVAAPYSFATTAGTTSGTLTSEVYKNLSGTLDFYYQVSNSATSATAIARNADTSFTGFQTAVGYRTDGGTIPGSLGLFVNGTKPPQIADRSSSGAGSVVGFDFNPPESAKIAAGTASSVLVISTDATQFVAGNASVIDGGTQTVASFQPTGAIPEPMSFVLMGGGLLALGGIRRFKKSV